MGGPAATSALSSNNPYADDEIDPSFLQRSISAPPATDHVSVLPPSGLVAGSSRRGLSVVHPPTHPPPHSLLARGLCCFIS